MTKKIYRLVVLFVALSMLASCTGLVPRSNRPNFLLIISDDQRYDTMQWMPQTQALLFDQGVTFAKGYDPTPVCCPSRASIFTGLFAHNDRVRTNQDKLKLETFMSVLHQNGYYTGFDGKYLNSYLGEPRPEFDFWVSEAGGVASYNDPNLNVNGTWAVHPGYLTYIFRDYALQFLDQASQQSKPFLLVYSSRAPHAPAVPAPEDKNLLQDLPPYRPPSFNEADVSNKPGSISGMPLMTTTDIANNDHYRRNQILSMTSLDRTVGDIINKLKAMGQLDNTAIFYISDNGVHWGEHRLSADKGSAYEEAIRIPFAMRYPPLVPKPYVEDHLVANIDIAPTILDLAGISPPWTMDGMSLVKLLKGEGAWRDHLLIEGWPARGYWTGIHTDRYVYIETENELSELYDLQTDPYEMNNLIHDSQYQSLIADLKAELEIERLPRITP